MSNQIVWKILSVWHRSSCLNVTDSEDEFLFGPTIWNHEGSILSLDPFDECVMFFFLFGCQATCLRWLLFMRTDGNETWNITPSIARMLYTDHFIPVWICTYIRFY